MQINIVFCSLQVWRKPLAAY